MAKKSNRESVVIGHLATKARPSVSILRSALAAGRPTEPEFSALEARLSATKLGELIEAETAAANQRADELDARPELYGGSGADPGSVVGLDAFIPDSDTATNGDPTRTDPDPS